MIASIVSQTGRRSARRRAQNLGVHVAGQRSPTRWAVIVSANDTDFATLGELIAAVSKPLPGSTLTIKVYPLANTSAPRVVRAVFDLFSPAPRGRQAQRVLQLAFDGGAGPDGRALRIDPATVRATADPAGRSLIIAAPADAIPLLDRFISLLDQAPMQDQFALRRFALSNARAEQAAPMLQQAFEAARQAAPEAPRPTLITDARTNAVLITGTEAHHRETESRWPRSISRGGLTGAEIRRFCRCARHARAPRSASSRPPSSATIPRGASACESPRRTSPACWSCVPRAS